MTRNTLQKSWRWWLRIRICSLGTSFHVWKSSFASTGFSCFTRVTLTWRTKLVLLILPIFRLILCFIINNFLLLGWKHSLLRFSCIFKLLIWVTRKFVYSFLTSARNVRRGLRIILIQIIIWTNGTRINIFSVSSRISFWVKLFIERITLIRYQRRVWLIILT